MTKKKKKIEEEEEKTSEILVKQMPSDDNQTIEWLIDKQNFPKTICISNNVFSEIKKSNVKNKMMY